MTHHRAERVGEQIRAALASAVREIRDPRVGFVTLTGVSLSPDLKQARIYVSRLGSEGERNAAVDALNQAAAYLRHEIAVRARLKYTPAIRFVSDATIERGSRVEAILQQIHADDAGGSGHDPESTG